MPSWIKPRKANLRERMAEEYRNQSRVGSDGNVVLSDTRIKAIQSVAPCYITLYGNDPSMITTREHFAMKNNTLPSEEARQKLAQLLLLDCMGRLHQPPRSRCHLYQQLAARAFDQ